MHAGLPVRWAVIIIICVIAVAAITVLLLLLSAPHQDTYTNAWYVMGYE